MESNLMKILKALSDENRLRILNLLQYGDLCVCELEILLEIGQSNVSRHLNKLTNAGILQYYKAAKYVYYNINEEKTKEYPFVKQVLNSASSKLEQCQEDYKRLSSYKDKGYTCDDLKNGKVCFNS
ncbi:ArsR/SmtB family transcription factor [Natranaerofaba carboxydovora]|uniref:ArsR/SmtB family transcription factor n=1 Tax=Natranaerofaba carboxydovora TaxID=2742683 RepID=UPI001F140A2E|nr:metalloregulator ArsR/SmtB family transcription factor [Natranaerofaba carboxydovora]